MNEHLPPSSTLAELCRELPLHQPPPELWRRIERATRPSPWRYAGASVIATGLVLVSAALLASLLLPTQVAVSEATPVASAAADGSQDNHAIAEALIETDRALEDLCSGLGTRACLRSALWMQRERLLEASASQQSNASAVWL